MKFPPLRQLAPHLGLFSVALLFDQISKHWALVRFNGIARAEAVEVLGSAWRWQLAYNEGAAFSMRPQQILPFLSPTIFYLILSLGAVIALSWFYTKLKPQEWPSHWGIALIMAGAIGNLVDRLHLGKVVDFVDWDFPDISLGNFHLERWPTFNLADTWVLIGVALILLTPQIARRFSCCKTTAEQPSASTPS